MVEHESHKLDVGGPIPPVNTNRVYCNGSESAFQVESGSSILPTRTMMTLSVIIPAWSQSPRLIDMTINLCNQVRPMCDEIIVSEDGTYNKEIERAADIYSYDHRRFGHVLNLNNGFEFSSGDYLALIDNDVSIEKGNLRDLCVPGKIIYPEWNEEDWQAYLPVQPYRNFSQWFFVIPREFMLELPPSRMDHPEKEGVDWWTTELRIRYPYEWSDKLSYNHIGRGSYGMAKMPS